MEGLRAKYHKYQRYGAKYGRYGTVKNGTIFFEMGSLRELREASTKTDRDWSISARSAEHARSAE